MPATTEAVDDYLKAILELSGPEEQRVTSNALAGHLEVRAASVTGMLQKLARQRPPLSGGLRRAVGGEPLPRCLRCCAETSRRTRLRNLT